MPQEQLEAMIGARFGRLSGLVLEFNGELTGVAMDLLLCAAEYPMMQPLAEYVGTRVLTTANEITVALQKLAADMKRHEAFHGDHGPGGPA